MSIESKSPSVYQYAPQQPYPSFPTTPFLSKNHQYETQATVNHIGGSPIQSTFPINYVSQSAPYSVTNNNKYPVYSPPPLISIPPPINETQYPKPLIEISKQSFSNQPLSQQQDDRYESYLNESQQYKYNLFSIIDEPWNNCLDNKQCSSVPNNECIARANPKKYWY